MTVRRFVSREVLRVALGFGCVFALERGLATAEDATGLMAADEQMVQQLLKPRSVSDLTAEYETAKRRADAADQDLAASAKIVSVARARVAVKKDEIALVKTRSKLARKEGDTADRAGIERTLEHEERSLKVFKAMEETAEAQKNRASAAADFARARMKLDEAELDLARKHEARLAESAAPGDAAALAKLGELDGKIRVAARSTLSSLREYAKMSKRLADSTSDLAKARLGLLDAWESYNGL